MKIAKNKFIIVAMSVVIFFLSLIITPYNISGDQYSYREFYQYAVDKSYAEVLSSSFGYIGSLEPVYPSLVWISAQILPKDALIACANFVLAFLSLYVFRLQTIPIFPSIALVLTNFYFLVLYTSAERLKFALIFLLFSFLLYRAGKIKSALLFSFLSLFTHVQVIFILAGEFIYLMLKKVNPSFRLKDFIFAIFFAVCVAFSFVYLQEHIVKKFVAYSSREQDDFGVVKVLILLLLALCVTSQRFRLICFSIPLVIASTVLGGERLVIFAYFIYMLNYPLGKHPVFRFFYYLILCYFAVKSIDYLFKIVFFGDGFHLQ